jgi:general secretion pathway protein K
MNNNTRHQRGLALITALLIVALVATVAAFVALNQQLWLRQMENVSDRVRTDYLRRGALSWAAIVLADDARNNSTDHLGETWAQKLPPLPVEGGTILIAAEDAQGRFNLNNLWRNNAPSAADIGIFQRLLASLAIDSSLSEALVDWMDPDAQTRPGGAEDIEYLNFEPPYRAGNLPLTSVDELRLVRGFSSEVVESLRPYVTVLPKAADININTASPKLVAALVSGLSESAAEQILAERVQNPFKDKAAFTSRLPAGAKPPEVGIGVKSGYFLVMLDTGIGRHRRRTEALVERADGKTSAVWHRSQPVTLARHEEAKSQ